MAFGTWFKNLITKGKALIKKAAPIIHKGVEIAKKVAPVIGGTIGNVINGVANAVDKGVNYIVNERPSTQRSISQDSHKVLNTNGVSTNLSLKGPPNSLTGLPTNRTPLGFQGAGQRIIPMLK